MIFLLDYCDFLLYSMFSEMIIPIQEVIDFVLPIDMVPSEVVENLLAGEQLELF